MPLMLPARKLLPLARLLRLARFRMDAFFLRVPLREGAPVAAGSTLVEELEAVRPIVRLSLSPSPPSFV